MTDLDWDAEEEADRLCVADMLCAEPEEAADALRIGENAIYELLNSKKLSAYKNGRNWLIPKEAVRKYVVEQSKLE